MGETTSKLLSLYYLFILLRLKGILYINYYGMQQFQVLN